MNVGWEEGGRDGGESEEEGGMRDAIALIFVLPSPGGPPSWWWKLVEPDFFTLHDGDQPSVNVVQR